MASQLPTSNINHNLILALMLNSNGRIKPHFRNLMEKSSQIQQVYDWEKNTFSKQIHKVYLKYVIK